MTLDQQLTAAAHHVADGVSVPEISVDAIRAKARAQRQARIAALAAAVAVVIVVVGTFAAGGRDVSAPVDPATTTTSAPTPTSETTQPRVRPIATASWPRYTSERYDLTVGHPDDWSEVPARRDWSWPRDVEDPLSEGHEVFLSPAGDVRVSVWEARLEPGTEIETMDDIEAWVEGYCEARGTPCDGVPAEGVQLCGERYDCHPGLLVHFEEDVHAFLNGGYFARDAITVVALWRGESHPSVQPYGGAQRLLEAFLFTMEVFRDPTPE